MHSFYLRKLFFFFPVGRQTESNSIDGSFSPKGQIDFVVVGFFFYVSAQECQGGAVRRTAGETQKITSEKRQLHIQVQSHFFYLN